jgi:hypothetical protein
VPLSYEIDTELGIVRVIAVGEPTIEDQNELGTQWSGDPDYRSGMPILLDNRLRSAPSNRAHISKVVEEARRSQLVQKGTRCAVVVASDAEYGMVRMFASMSEDRPLVTKPFRDISSAEQWLISDGE